jgi:hypothetical protein
MPRFPERVAMFFPPEPIAMAPAFLSSAVFYRFFKIIRFNLYFSLHYKVSFVP